MSFEATLFYPSDTETIFKDCKLSAFKEAYKRLPTKLKFKKKVFLKTGEHLETNDE